METARKLILLVRNVASPSALRALLERHGGAEALLAAGPRSWREDGLDEDTIAQLSQARLPARDLAWLDAPGHHLIGWLDPDYPALLRRVANAPAALFVAGDPDLLWHPQVAVVGTRRPSAGGRENARRFAQAFSRAGLAVTSGLAEGIDTAAHLGAMEAGRTLAVVATGPDLCFPSANAALHRRIVEAGTVVSEFPPGTRARREYFPRRNRLIAGLSLGTVVVEAAQRSGALITARMAADAGREVYALPGSIHNPVARGCHRLIREGAGLVESPEEVIAGLTPVAGELAEALRGRLTPAALSSAAEPPLPDPEDPDALRLWCALDHDPVNLDQLAARSGLTVAALSSMLLAMELEGRVVAEHGRYARRS
jgi:DNA processing protein